MQISLRLEDNTAILRSHGVEPWATFSRSPQNSGEAR
jgi:hypothetical protein